MTAVVIDASMALAWCFPDEANEHADRVLVALEGKTILIPSNWGLEVANALLVGERSNRLRPPELRRFSALLENLPLVQDAQPVGHHIAHVLPLARKYNLSAYDAAYLELSLRRSAALATFDVNLQRAARRAGVPSFNASAHN